MIRKIGADGDMATSGQQFISGVDEVKQAIASRLRLFKGEHFRNINLGTPWFEVILGKGSSLTAKDAAIKQQITKTKGVNSILEYKGEYDINTRKYSVTATILTEFGVIGFTTVEVI